MDETRRRRFARAAAVPLGLIASGALVFAGSQSAFTATTSNAGNAWQAGKVKLQNDGSGTMQASGGAAAFTVTKIKPGDTGSRCIQVESDSDVDGTVRFFVSSVGGAAGVGGQPLTSQLQLRVESAAGQSPATCAGFTPSTTVHDWSLMAALPTSFGTASATTEWSTVGDSSPTYRTYRVSWRLPTDSSNNLVMGGTAQATLNWEIRAGA
jgi:hypothetical protein